MRYVGSEVDGLNPQEVAEEEECACEDWGEERERGAGAGFQVERGWFEDGTG